MPGSVRKQERSQSHFCTSDSADCRLLGKRARGAWVACSSSHSRCDGNSTLGLSNISHWTFFSSVLGNWNSEITECGRPHRATLGRPRATLQALAVRSRPAGTMTPVCPSVGSFLSGITDTLRASYSSCLPAPRRLSTYLLSELKE